MSQKTYSTIPIEKQNPTSLSKNEKGSYLADIAGKDGLITAKMDQEVVDEIISKSIYNNPNVAIREIFNNAVRQCETSEELGATPHINVKFDVKNNRLIFEEIDSMGMTVQTFKDVYRHTGRSGNLDGTKGGQFGIGKKSYRAIADIMIFETFARETSEKYAFLTKGSKFEELPEPNMKQFGTRVSLVIKEGVSLLDLAKYVTRIARFTKVQTYLEISESLKNKDGDIEIKKGQKKIGPISEKEFIAKEIDENIEDVIWIELDKPDYHLIAAYTSGHASDDQIFVNLVGIPISLGEHQDEYGHTRKNKIADPGFECYVLNIRDERKYPPTASRDYLKEDSFNKLNEVIKKDLLEFFDKTPVKTIEDYAKCSEKYFVERMPHEPFDDAVPDETHNFCNFLHMRNPHIYKTNDKGEIKEERGYGSKDLKDHIQSNPPIMYSFNHAKKRIEAVIAAEPNALVIVPDGTKHDKYAAISVMSRVGTTSVSDFLKSRKIKVGRNTQTEVSLRTGYSYNNHISCDMDDLTENDIRIPKEELEDVNIREYVSDLVCYRANDEYYSTDKFEGFRFLRNQKKLEESQSLSLEEFIIRNKRREFETSDGIKTGREILENYNKIHILRRYKSKFADRLTTDFCKTQISTEIIIIEEESKSTLPTKEVSLMLTARLEGRTHFEFIEDNLDEIIRNEMLQELEISYDGNWRDAPDMALKHLKPIKSSWVREMYAEAYSNTSNNWDSMDKVFQSIDGKENQTVIECYQKLQTSKILEAVDFEDEMMKIVKYHLVSEIRDIPNVKKRIIKIAELSLHDKVIENSITVNVENEIIISFDICTKMTINKKLLSLIKKVSGTSNHDVVIDGNKIQVILT